MGFRRGKREHIGERRRGDEGAYSVRAMPTFSRLIISGRGSRFAFFFFAAFFTRALAFLLTSASVGVRPRPIRSTLDEWRSLWL